VRFSCHLYFSERGAASPAFLFDASTHLCAPRAYGFREEKSLIKQYLECGKVVSTHGIVGEIKVQPWCDSAEDLASLTRLYLDGGKTPLRIDKGRVQKNMVLLKFDGFDTIEQAATLRGRILWLDRGDLPLKEGEHFVQDLLGAKVIDADTEKVYGTLTDITQTGANDVYHITFPDDRVFLIPAIEQVIVDIDAQLEIVKIRPLKGLFDDED
jgi:16S rRNA processing protein RimM